MPTRRSLLKALGLGGLTGLFGSLGKAAAADETETSCKSRHGHGRGLQTKPSSVQPEQEQPLVTVEASPCAVTSARVYWNKDGREIRHIWDVELRFPEGRLPQATLTLFHSGRTELSSAKDFDSVRAAAYTRWWCDLDDDVKLTVYDEKCNPVPDVKVSALIDAGRYRTSYFQVICPAIVRWNVGASIQEGRDWAQNLATMQQEHRTLPYGIEMLDSDGSTWWNNNAGFPSSPVFHDSPFDMIVRLARKEVTVACSATAPDIPTTVLG